MNVLGKRERVLRSRVRVRQVEFLEATAQLFGQRFTDGFGNRVHTFNLRPAHAEVRILAASVVEVNPRLRDLAGSTAVLPLKPQECGLELLDFLHLRGPVRRSSRLEPVHGWARISSASSRAEPFSS